MESDKKTEPVIDLVVLLNDFLRQARHMWALLLVLILICAGGLSFLRYRSFSPVYEASASFTIKVANPLHATVEAYNRETAEQMAKTFPYILTSGVLQQRIREYLGVSYVPSISAKAMESANIFTLTVRDSDPQRAHDVLNAAIACYPEISDFVVGPTVFYLLDETGIPKVNWKTVVEMYGYEQDITSEDQSFPFKAEECRYVRLNFTKGSTKIDNNLAYCAALSEVEIWGKVK